MRERSRCPDTVFPGSSSSFAAATVLLGVVLVGG
jgi:hypothetical protein